MSDPSPTWQLPRHTGAKHSILRRYLEAWFPILTAYHGEVVVIDGFAGPGQYSGGELGSPLIALEVAMTHQFSFSGKTLRFVFIEKDQAYFRHLVRLLQSKDFPPFIQITPVNDSFELVMPRVLDALEAKPRPTFILVDPFGVSGFPFELVRRIAGLKRSEILVSLMTEFINRFKNQPELEARFRSLFGLNTWHRWEDRGSPERNWSQFRDLYTDQLTAAGFEYVRWFGMRDERGRLEYFLIFATKSKLGLTKMKHAMWKLDPSGNYEFSDATNPDQLTLFAREPNYNQLRHLISRRFKGQIVSVEAVEDFVVCETAFLETHVRRALKEAEETGEVHVVGAAAKRRRGTFPPRTLVEFSSV